MIIYIIDYCIFIYIYIYVRPRIKLLVPPFPLFSPKQSKASFFVKGPLRSVGNQISVLLNAPLAKNLGQQQHGNCISSGHENSSRVILN